MADRPCCQHVRHTDISPITSARQSRFEWLGCVIMSWSGCQRMVKALYYGLAVNDRSLTPGDHPRLGPTRFEDWLSHNAEPVAAAGGAGR
jgi:hypothetical protein